MAKNNYKFWVNPETNILYDTWGSNSAAATPVFLQGDTVEVEVHLVRWTQGTTRYMEEVPFPSGSTLRLAVGKIDTAPTSGTYTLSYGGDTTTPLAYNATGAQIQTALNALASITAAGGVLVTKLTNSIIKVVFNIAGVNTTLSCDGLALSPPCSTKLITLQAGSLSVAGAYLIKIKQSPVVYQETWNDIEQPTLTVTELSTNRAKRVTISPDPKSGSWSLTGTEAIFPKIQVDGNEDNLAQYWGENLTQRFSIGATEQNFQGFQYACTKVETYVWDFSVINNYDIPVGYTMPFTATGDGLVGYVGKTAFVDFNTAEIEYLLDGLSSATAYLELELTDSSGNKQTLLQTQVTIKNDMIDSASFSPLSLEGGIPEAPEDGSLYARKDGSWFAFIPEDNVGITEAPINGSSYVRQDGSWVLTPIQLTGGILTSADGTLKNKVFPDIIKMWATTDNIYSETRRSGFYVADGSLLNETNLTAGSLSLKLGSNTMSITPDGITFADLITQTTAWIDAPVDGTPYLRKDGAWSSSIDGGTY